MIHFWAICVYLLSFLAPLGNFQGISADVPKLLEAAGVQPNHSPSIPIYPINDITSLILSYKVYDLLDTFSHIEDRNRTLYYCKYDSQFLHGISVTMRTLALLLRQSSECQIKLNHDEEDEFLPTERNKFRRIPSFKSKYSELSKKSTKKSGVLPIIETLDTLRETFLRQRDEVLGRCQEVSGDDLVLSHFSNLTSSLNQLINCTGGANDFYSIMTRKFTLEGEQLSEFCSLNRNKILFGRDRRIRESVVKVVKTIREIEARNKNCNLNAMRRQKSIYSDSGKSEDLKEKVLNLYKTTDYDLRRLFRELHVIQ